MKAYAIVLKDHRLSEDGYKTLYESSHRIGNTFKIERIDATTPEEAVEFMGDICNIYYWSWPWDKEEFDFRLGIKKVPYFTKSPYARVACALSHLFLWDKIAKSGEPGLILEHDAMFINKLPDIQITPDQVLGINDPRGATRKSTVYHNAIQESKVDYPEAPWVDDDRTIVQGLAGNSAYIIGPEAALAAVHLVQVNGIWPNDATLCKQNFGNMLRVSKTYYTKIQGLPSTTSN